VRAILLVVAAVAPALTQMQQMSMRETVSLSGELKADSAVDFGPLTVELESLGGGVGLPERATVSPNGLFTFSMIPAGNYQLKVIDSSGNVITQDLVFAQRGSGPVIINMPNMEKERPASGTISAKRLGHTVPDKARKEFDRSEKAMKQGDIEKSIAHLVAAVKIDPQYVEAHNNLGSRYLGKKDFPAAIRCFRAALEIDPDDAMVNSNLAIALSATGDWKEAERAARRSLESNSASGKTRYVLALALMYQNKDPDEALFNFRAASGEVLAAHLGAAKVLSERGDQGAAEKELQEYLSNDPKNRAAVEEWLAKLRDGSE
jgi:tetratricopeptide (TPR) repeat protein